MLPGGSNGLIHSELICNANEILHALDIDVLRMFSWAKQAKIILELLISFACFKPFKPTGSIVKQMEPV